MKRAHRAEAPISKPTSGLPHSDRLGLGLLYNFVVKPPNDGAEYSLLLAPKPGTKVTVPALPLGASTIRVVVVDAW